MADGKIVIEIKADDSDIKKVRKSIEELESTAKGSAKGVKNVSDEVSNLGDKSSGTFKDVKNVGSGVDELADSGEDASKVLKTTSGELQSLADSSIEASSATDEVESSMDDLIDSSSEATSNLGSVAESLDDTSESAISVSKDTDNVRDALDGVSDSGSDTIKSMGGVSSALEDTAGSASEVGKEANSATSGMDSLADSASQTANEASGMGKEVSESADDVDKLGKESSKGSSNVKDLAISMGLVKIASAAFGVMNNALDGAIKRFDTMNQFPRVLENLGVSAEESEKSIERLSEGIDGLPTAMNEIADTAQRMYTSFNDMDKATESAIALNNALIGSGSSAADAQRGTDMYLKSLQRGNMDMVTWNTLTATMDTGLIKVADSFGYTKDELYDAMKSGTVSMTEFNDKLIEVGTGTGIMAELAQTATAGIATSISKLKTAAVKGMTDVIEAVDTLAKNVTGKNISANLDSLKDIVKSSFKAIASSIQATEPVLILFAGLIKTLIPIVSSLTPVILGLTAAYATYVVWQKANSVISASNKVLRTAMAATEAVTFATKASMIAKIKAIAVDELDEAAKLKNIATTMAETGVLSLKAVIIGVLTKEITIATAAQMIWNAIIIATKVAIDFLTGGLGILITVIAVLATALFSWMKWGRKANAETKKLASETETLAKDTKELNDSIDSSAKSHKENVAAIESSKKATNQLADEIDGLAKMENKSAADKVVLNAKIQELNESVDGLSLAYDDETNSLNENIEQIKKRNEAQKEQEKLTVLQKRAIELSKEQSEIEIRLTEIQKIKSKQFDESIGKSKDLRKADEELTEESERLSAQLVNTGAALQANGEMMSETSEKVATATKEGVYVQIKSYEELEGAQKDAFDSMKSGYDELRDKSTNAFDAIEQNTVLSIDTMAANLEKNEKAVEEWSSNMKILADRGVDEGLLKALRDGGPKMAEQTKYLVNAGTEELESLSEKYGTIGNAAISQFAKAHNFEESEIPESIRNLIEKDKRTLEEEIKLADFAGTGKLVPDDMAIGISENKEPVVQASAEVVDEAKESMDKKVIERNFLDTGADQTKDYAAGISDPLAEVANRSSEVIDTASESMDKTFGEIDWAAKGEVAPKGTAEGINNSTGEVEVAASNVGTAAGDSAEKSIEQQGAVEIGVGFGTDVSAGIESTTPLAMESAKKLGDTIVKNFKKEIEKMEKVTTKAMDATDKAFTRGGKTVEGTNKGISKAIPQAYSSLKSAMENVGANAMSGLNAGLLSGQSAVLATARSTASQIESVMKKALDIHSPSRVMRDGIGIYIPQGVAEGIEKDSYKIDDSLNKMTSSFSIPNITAEMALDIGSKMFTSKPCSTQNEQITTTNSSNMKKALNLLEEIRDKSNDTFLNNVKVSENIARPLDNVQRQRMSLVEWGLEL